METNTEELDKRIGELNNWLNITMIDFLRIVGVLVTGLLGFIGKLTFFPNP